jgi:hypothetical protein
MTLTKNPPQKIAVVLKKYFFVKKRSDKTVRFVKINQRGESQRLDIASNDAKTQPVNAT